MVKINHRILYKIGIVLTFFFLKPITNIAQISWPSGQALPHFATPADTLDGLFVADKSLTPGERLMFTALQGLVNRQQPRIFLFEQEREGKYKWPNLLKLPIREYPVAEKWKLVGKYKNEVAGIVLYSTEKSTHYANLASTVAGLKNALPLTSSEYTALQVAGIQLPVVEDLTGLTDTTSIGIYTYLYEHYWEACTKRLILSLNSRLTGYVRDMGIATGAAILWLDPRKEEENAVLRLFLKDMKAGESIMLGWWAEERSGIGIGTEYGISTIPSDFYENATVYSGINHTIHLPSVPKKPELQNKIYIAVFMSDGDNVQYCQHAMSDLWDNKNRGIIPINWTVSPGLADIGPGILNYYYQTATPNDFFASGPSGLGYALIYDAHNYKWNTTGRAKFDAYSKFSQQYLEKSGLRVITVWDEVSSEQMESYTDYCRYLYGVTQQDWERQKGKIPTFVKQNKLAFIPNYPCYANGIDVIFNMNKDTIQQFDGTHPIFLSAQGESWKMGPENIVALRDQLEALSPGNIVICRGDHFFALYNEANRMDFNLTLSGKLEITSSAPASFHNIAADGSCSEDKMWIAKGKKGTQWVQFDFKEQYLVNRYVIRHAGASGLDDSFNSASFLLETSIDGKKWKKMDQQSGNKSSVTDKDVAEVKARYVRLTITNPGKDGISRIADVEIYGKKASN